MFRRLVTLAATKLRELHLVEPKITWWLRAIESSPRCGASGGVREPRSSPSEVSHTNLQSFRQGIEKLG